MKIQMFWQVLFFTLLWVLFFLPVGDSLSAPLVKEVLLLREPDTRGFLTLFDVMLIPLTVRTYFRLRALSKQPAQKVETKVLEKLEME